MEAATRRLAGRPAFSRSGRQQRDYGGCCEGMTGAACERDEKARAAGFYAFEGLRVACSLVAQKRALREPVRASQVPCYISGALVVGACGVFRSWPVSMAGFFLAPRFVQVADIATGATLKLSHRGRR